AEMRGCYDGMSTYLGNTRGDEWGCIGSWYTGAWRTSASLGYVSNVQAALNAKAWLTWPDQSGALPAATPQVDLAAPTTAAPRTTGAPAPPAAKPAAAPKAATTVPPAPTTTPTTAASARVAPEVATTTTSPSPTPATSGDSAELKKLRDELNSYCATH